MTQIEIDTILEAFDAMLQKQYKILGELKTNKKLYERKKDFVCGLGYARSCVEAFKN